MNFFFTYNFIVFIFVQQCFDDILTQTWKHELGEWKQEKRKILNSMVAPSGNLIDISKTSMFLDPSSQVYHTTLLDKQEAIYANKVIEYNKSLTLANFRSNLVEIFSSAAEEFQDKV